MDLGCKARYLAIATGLTLAACNHDDPGGTASGPRSSETVVISIAGSSALVPLVTEAAGRYMRTHPGVTVQVSAGGSQLGLAQVVAGAVTVGDSDIFAAPGQSALLEDHKVAVVGFAAMARKGEFNAAVTSFTRDQLRGIFTGQLRNWSDVGGSDQVITVINRARNSGSRVVFGATALGGGDVVEGTAEQDNSGQLQGMLLQQPGAISYLSLSYRTDALKAFAFDGVAPTPENIESGRYAIWSYEHMYTRGHPPPPVQGFLDYMNSPEIQSEVIPRMNFIPISAMHVSRDHD